MAGTIEINGTGGIIEGNLGAANVNVNLDYALDFAGTDEYISVPDHNDLSFGNGSADSVLSISAWVYQDTAAFFPIISKGGYNQSNGEYLLSVSSSGHLQFEMYDESESDTYIGRRDATNMGQGVWNHVAVTYDATEANTGINLYLNGVLVDDTDNSGGSYTAMENLGAVVKIGAAKSSGIYANGKIADVRIYAEELSLANIQVLASRINGDNTLGAGTTNLKGHWKLNESTIDDLNAGSVLDSSGNSHHGQCVGWDNDAAVEASRIHDAFSVDVQDNTTTMGHIDVAQGVLNPKSLISKHFDGVNDIIRTGSNILTGSTNSKMTASMWFNCDVVEGSTWLLGNGAGAADWYVPTTGWVIFIRNTTVEALKCGIEGQQVNCPDLAAALSANRWYHLTVTFNGTVVTWYLDGVNVGSVTMGASFDPRTDQVFAGYSTENGSNPTAMDGKMRDIRIYDGVVLSAEQATSVYNGSYNVTPTYWWKINATGDPASSGTTSQTMNEVSGTGHSEGTLNVEGIRVLGNGTVN